MVPGDTAACFTLPSVQPGIKVAGLPVIAQCVRRSEPGLPAVTFRRAVHVLVRAVNPGGPRYPVAGCWPRSGSGACGTPVYQGAC
jgi:hypothetical protein